jgi:hypothetical protein
MARVNKSETDLPWQADLVDDLFQWRLEGRNGMFFEQHERWLEELLEY